MWLALRELPTERRFRRQHPIGSHVVDFACPGRKLAIELDSGQHAQQEQEDAARTLEIARRGYRVIRFWNNDVLHNLAGVLEVIDENWNALSALRAEREGTCRFSDGEGEVGTVGALQPPPHPDPLRPKGQRGR
jgi:BirA family biotin operon repressor/biotin-[acetyl-CoA-carboxylase] ligase